MMELVNLDKNEPPILSHSTSLSTLLYLHSARFILPVSNASIMLGGRRIRVYEVGSSDLHYMVTETSSSSSGCAPSSIDYQRSQEEAQAMRTELEDIKARLENETMAREDLMARLETERKAREDLQQHINEAVKRELQDFMKNWRSSN
ncbi:hypothetical protein Hanom_Chr11g01027751 [Helianthus anomalus]